MTISNKLVDGMPSDQNVIDLFQGEWSSRMPNDLGITALPGHAPLFEDVRIAWANEILGPFDGLDVIELGPLEGAHAAMIEHYGARSVTSIEANPRAFLKCLCVKEILGLRRTRFKLGSFIPFLESSGQTDLLVASGVLYHMVEPLRLLDLICARSDRIFLWTHIYEDGVIAGRHDHALFARPEMVAGTSYRAAKRLYPEAALSWQGFSGGAETYAVWLERDSLMAYFRDRGFSVEIAFDEPYHVNGPAIAVCARRQHGPAPRQGLSAS